jgi:hypothetical protein
MNKSYQSYTEAVEHNGENLQITINVYKEPVVKTNDQAFYTHIKIHSGGKHWGELLLQEPMKEKNFEQAIKDIYSNIDLYKTDELSQQQISKN